MCAPVGYCLRLNYSLLCALQRTHTHTRTHRRKRSADPAPSRFMGDAPASLQAIIVRCACALFSNTHQQPLGPVVVRLKGAFRALPPYPPSATAPVQSVSGVAVDVVWGDTHVRSMRPSVRVYVLVFANADSTRRKPPETLLRCDEF